jgi:hypothetical protein
VEISVFVSCPTTLTPLQNKVREVILDQLRFFKLEPRALGRSDYPTKAPLREVLAIARHCSGAVVLGFEQFRATEGEFKPGTRSAAPLTEDRSFPSEWNHLEAGILFGLGLPLLIFREGSVRGGIFDDGVTDVFTHRMPDHRNPAGLDDVFIKWQADVRSHYYRD